MPLAAPRARVVDPQLHAAVQMLGVLLTRRVAGQLRGRRATKRPLVHVGTQRVAVPERQSLNVRA